MRSRTQLSLILTVLSIAVLVIPAALLSRGGYRIRSVEGEGLVTWNTQRILLGEKGAYRSPFTPGRVEKRIMELPYVEKAEASVSDGVLRISVVPSSYGILLRNGGAWAFLSRGDVSALDRDDIPYLVSSFPVVDTSGLPLFPSKREEKEKWMEMMAFISSSFRSSRLITSAEYGNNNREGFSPSITLSMPGLESRLEIRDTLSAVYLPEALEAVERAYVESPGRLDGKTREYVLEDGVLSEKR